MKPKTAPAEKTRQDELFRNRLENHIDLNHELVILTNQINWSRFEREFADMFCEGRGMSWKENGVLAIAIHVEKKNDPIHQN
ncbi:MAG: hypothetical protein LBT05_05780 [Planctomycetaceae bacterium]|jgi:hypothetical protein|nr:hypothetical protein [Planctomycetaceae bacterium]